jgi:hypothetical protein
VKLADLFAGTDSRGRWFLKGRLGWARLLIVEQSHPTSNGATHAAILVERNNPSMPMRDRQWSQQQHGDDDNHDHDHDDDGDETP